MKHQQQHSKSDNSNVFTSAIITAGGAVLVVGVWWIWEQRRDAKRKQKLPPYPPSATIFQSLRTFNDPRGPQLAQAMAYELDYPKAFAIRVPVTWRGLVFVVDHKVMRTILADPLTTKPAIMYSPTARMLSGNNLFSEPSNGPFWQVRRKGSRHAFSSMHIKRMGQCCDDVIDQWIQETLLKEKKNDNDGTVISICDEMISITLRVICLAAFDYDLSLEESIRYLQEMTLCSGEFIIKQSSNPFRQLLFWDAELRRSVEAKQYLRDFSLKIIRHHREKNTKNKHSAGDDTSADNEDDDTSSKTLIGLIVNNPHYNNDVERAADVSIFLFGGHDTTGYALAWILYHLATHPEEMTKLRTALREKGRQCSELQNVIRESLRLTPSLAIAGGRIVGRDYEDDHLFLPRGTIICPHIYLMHRNPKLFPYQPDAFVPSRWDDATKDQIEALLPWSYGARNCIAQSLAKAEMNHVIPPLIRDFDWHVVQEATSRHFVTTKPDGAMLRAVPVTNAT